MERKWLIGVAMLMLPLAAQADDRVNDTACDFFVATHISGTETMYPHEVPVWKADCERHPDISRCEDANEMVKKRRGIAPLHCVGKK